MVRSAEVTVLESGQIITHHRIDECDQTWFCAIHNLMPGPWESWPRFWREDRGIMERICPCGVGHPVAEMVDWAVASGKGHELVHGCCGCPCVPQMASPMVRTPLPLRTGHVPAPLNRLELLKDALDLISDLWPKPSYASVTLESHQWIKLRRVLLAIPDLVDTP